MKPTLYFIFLALILSLFTAPATGRASGSDGAKVFASRGCADCHSVVRPNKAVTRADFLAQKGPDLWYAGSKFRDGFLARWLADPTPIRPLEYNSLEEQNRANHPRLKTGEAGVVASYLMSLKAGSLVQPVGIRPSVNVRGRVVFIKKFACYGCHLVKVRGNTAGGLSGPTLEGTRIRLNPDWLYAFLTNQRAFTPISRMPVYEGLAAEADMRALAAYTAGLK